MSNVHRQRFKEAVRKVVNKGISVWTRTQVKTNQLHTLVPKLHAAI
jgi:hypothetical protein